MARVFWFVIAAAFVHFCDKPADGQWPQNQMLYNMSQYPQQSQYSPTYQPPQLQQPQLHMSNAPVGPSVWNPSPWACGLNLEGKVQRPALNFTSQANSGARKPFNKVNFARPTQDTFRSQFSANDFTIDLIKGVEAARTPDGLGAIFLADVNNLPALYREGISMAAAEVAACAVVAPHVHPRAVEIVYVTEGGVLELGILDGPANNRFIIEQLSAGQMGFVPKGLAHYAVNRSCNVIRFLAIFGGQQGEDAGIWFTATSVFDIQPDVAASSLDISPRLANQLRQSQPSTLFFKGRDECLRRCGLTA